MYHKIWDLVEGVSWLIFYGIAPAAGTPRKMLWSGSMGRFARIEAVPLLLDCPLNHIKVTATRWLRQP
jgi:hypothetical protein